MIGAINKICQGPRQVYNALKDPEGPQKKGTEQTAAMVGASAMSIRMMYKAAFKNDLVDAPLAFTEGLRATPRLYRETGEARAHHRLKEQLNCCWQGPTFSLFTFL